PVQLARAPNVAVWILQPDDAASALLRPEEKMSADREQPLPAVGARAILAPVEERAQKRLLREVIGVCFVPRQEARVSRDARQPAKRFGAKGSVRRLKVRVCEVHDRRKRHESLE